MYDSLSDLRSLDLPFDVDLVDEQCYKCVRKQLEKYKNRSDENNKPYSDRFVVPCKGIPKQIIDPALESIYTEEELEDLKAMADPVAWAKKYLIDNNEPWIARWYQAEILKCTSIRKTLRISRRTGKTTLVCIDILYSLFTKEGTKIVVAGPHKPHVEEIFKRVRTLLNNNPILSSCVARSRDAPYYDLELTNGSYIRGFAVGSAGGNEGVGIRGQDANKILLEEADHIDPKAIGGAILPILHTYPDTSIIGFSTPSGMKTPFYRFCEEDPTFMEFWHDYTVHPNKEVIERDRHQYTEDEWTHEFCLSGNTKVLTLKGPKNICDITNKDVLFSSFDKAKTNVIVPAKITHKNSEVVSLKTWSSDIVCTPDHGFNNLSNKKIKAKDAEYLVYKFPSYFYDEDKNKITARLVGFLNGDGSVVRRTIKKHKVNNKWYFYKKPQVRLQASFYGPNKEDLEAISRDIRILFPDIKASVTEKYKGFWQIILGNVASKYFVDRGAIVGKKPEVNPNIPNWICNNQEYMVEYTAALFGAEGSTPRTNEYYKFCTISLTMSKRGAVRDKSLKTISGFLNSIGISNTITTRLLYIDLVNEGPTLTTNTTITILNKQQNIKEFERVGYRYNYEKELILYKASKYLDYIQWCLDERKRIVEFCVINKHKYSWKKLAEKLNVKNHRTLAKSVLRYKKSINRKPTSKLVKTLRVNEWLDKYTFYDGVWQPILNKTTKSNETVYNITVDSSNSSYLLEKGLETYNCALWGSSEDGVYKKSYVDRSLRSYTYEECTRTSRWVYGIGVDWNEKHGTEIIVLGKEPSSSSFKPVDGVVVEKSQFTQLAGIAKVIEMVKKWKPSFMYIDAGGGGSTNYEVLYRTSMDNRRPGGDPDIARIADIMKKYDSGAAVEARDPITGGMKKFPAKQFMVNASVRLFEQERIVISSSDKVLESQLRNYIIKRISPNGTPVYGLLEERIGDHRLDALNLAVVGFHLEFGDLHHTSITIDVGAIPGPRTRRLAEKLTRNTQEYEPSDRRLENIDNICEGTMLPGRIDNRRVKIYRRGFDTDEEEKYLRIGERIRRSKQRRRGVPRRSTW